MPLLHYFAAVCSVLVALLFAADAYLPATPARSEPVRTYDIRVASERKGPEAITFSGPSVDYGQPQEHALVVDEPHPSASSADATGKLESVRPQAKSASAEATAPPPQVARKRVAKRKPRSEHNGDYAELRVWHDSFASSRQRTIGWW